MKMKIVRTKKRFYLSIMLLQIILILGAFMIINAVIGSASAQGEEGTIDPSSAIFFAISAAAAVIGSTLAAANVIKTVGTAAISALTENEGAFFKAFLVVALGEALAIYGLIVAILLWTKIPTI